MRASQPVSSRARATPLCTLDAFGKPLGFIPNLHRLTASSPAVLNGFVGLQGSLMKTLDAKTRHCISLAVSEVNGCDYCVSAHGHVAGTFGKMPPEEIVLAREGRSNDPRREAATRFAKRVTETRGKVTDADLAAVREAGFTDPQIVEIVALSAQSLLTNFINNVADTDIDFPVAEPAAQLRNLPQLGHMSGQDRRNNR